MARLPGVTPDEAGIGVRLGVGSAGFSEGMVCAVLSTHPVAEAA